MTYAKVWKQGQLTIPASLRKELGLDEAQIVSLVKVGNSILLTPKRLEGDSLATKAEMILKKKKISLGDVLKDLEDERRRYHQEHYGR